LPRDRVVVIDRNDRASLPSSYAALAAGEVRPASVRRPRERLARRGIEFIRATVQQIDVQGRLVRAEGRELRFDNLVVALGTESVADRIPGLADGGHAFHTFDAAERLAASLRYFAGGRVTIVIGDEHVWTPAAYELAMLIEHWFHRKKMRQKVEISVLTAESAPMEAFGADASELIAGQLAHKGIEFAGHATVTAVDHAARSIEIEGQASRSFDMVIAWPPQAVPRVLAEAGLADERGRATVDGRSMQTVVEGVFAMGDCARVETARGEARPNGVLTVAEAEVIAQQIAARVDGGTPAAPRAHGRAFVEVGAGAAIMLSGDFLDGIDRLKVAQPSIVWHWAKAAAERRWLLGW
jgi:sulfide:quinone oxidoreductase